MPVQTEPLSQLRGLLEATRLVRTHAELPELFEAIARTVSETLGFRTVVINAYRPAWDDFEVVTVHGSPDARAQLLGTITSHETWRPYLAERFQHGEAHLVPEELRDWEDEGAHVPELEALSAADAWRAEDSLVVPLVHSAGHMLGIISVDEPDSGLRPGDEELAVLTAVAGHVAGAIEDAQAAADAMGVRGALAHLLEISTHLTEPPAGEAPLDLVARGIHEALRFEKVAVVIGDGRGRFVPRGTAGWEPGAPELEFGHSLEDIQALLDPQFEREGCYLLTREEALERSAVGATYVSQRSGRGPRAWNRHWLIVPLTDRTGELLGFIWVDDPEDCLLPSADRLAALRTFANHAAAALHAAQDFEALTRRNDELTALHQTTIALLDRIGLDSVLEAIVDNAASLVGTRNGYLYLIEEGELRLRVRLGVFEDAAGIAMHRGEGVAGRVWESGRSLAVDDYSTWEGRYTEHSWAGLHSTVGVPLRVEGEVVGVLGVSLDDPERAFGQTDAILLERFAKLASLALQNARLFEELRRSGELHRLVVEGSSDLIYVLAPDARILFASPSAEAAIGYAPEELIGRSYAEFIHPDDLPEVRTVLTEQLGANPLTVARVRHRDGRWVVLEGTRAAIRDERGDVEAVVAIARDVTHRIAAEEERERLEEQLRQAQKMESVGLLAGGIAHDFNNLLTAIGGYAELSLIELGDDSPAHESIAQIARAADRAAKLTSQLLAFSRKQVLHPRVLDLNEVVGELATMLARMLGEDVILSTALDPDLGGVKADPTQVEQVLLNLAINARDAMPDGGSLLIRTGGLELREGEPPPHPDLPPGSYVTLYVRDSGVGMTPDLTERIFEPFFTTKGVGEGTGLGLSTVHGIVSQSGGAIWVESEPGAGTSFTICLPRLEPAASD